MYDLFWTRTYSDLKSRIVLTYGEKSAKTWQEYQTFILVAKQILGGGKEDKVEPPKSVSEAREQWAKMFNGKGQFLNG